MNKKKFKAVISLFFVSISMFLTPIYVDAKSIDSYINSATIKNMTKSSEKESDKTTTEKKIYSECESVLGDVNDEESVAWLLQKLLNYIKILGPTIAIVMGSIDFTKAILASDEEHMKKTQKSFVNRLIAAILLFFIPLLVSILLGFFGITTDNATCGLK